MARAIFLTVAFCLGLVLAGCHDPDRYLLGPEHLTDAIRIDLSAPSVPADGVSRIAVTATLAERTATSNRTLKFKTTLGKLYAGSTRGANEVTVDADTTGRAVVELESETTIGTARVEVSAGPTNQTISSVIDVPFVALTPDDAFTLTANPASIPADGFSRSTIRVELRPRGGSTQRTVAFQAFTTGLLFGAGESAGALSKTVTATSEGVATVQLQSSHTLETARVQATALGVTREVQVVFTAADPGSILTVRASPSSIPADDISVTRVTATVAAGLPPARRIVRFTTTLGAFDAAGTKTIDVTADGANRAVADLRAERTTGPAIVRATLTVDGVSDSTTVQFVPALPDRIFVTVNNGRVSAASGSVTVRAELLRDAGKPSEKTLVTYSAVDANGAPVGIFSNQTLSDTNGVSTATFTPGPSAAPGVVTIRASVAGSIVGSTTVEIIP